MEFLSPFFNKDNYDYILCVFREENRKKYICNWHPMNFYKRVDQY